MMAFRGHLNEDQRINFASEGQEYNARNGENGGFLTFSSFSTIYEKKYVS